MDLNIPQTFLRRAFVAYLSLQAFIWYPYQRNHRLSLADVDQLNQEVQRVTDLVILNGPEIGRTLRVREGVAYLGRSLDNDIRIDDKTVSRKHLKIESIRDKHFVTDLSSRNGTFYNGKYVVPGHEVEVEEGVPLAIGMTVICFGKGCREQIVPFLDTVSLIREKKERERPQKTKERGLSRKGKTCFPKYLLLSKTAGLGDPRKVLGHIFHHLKRIDRGAFVLARSGDIADRANHMQSE